MEISEHTRIFIKQHLTDDVRALALKVKPQEDLDLPFALTQIEGWQKAKDKLPSWAVDENILYPPHLSMEQCSSELTAQFKQQIVVESKTKLDTFADLTGGFGIDCAFIGKLFQQAYYVERQELLCQLAKNNFLVRNLKNVNIYHTDAKDFLLQTQHMDWLFIDPARRNQSGGKMVALEDCEPNILELKDLLLEKADKVMAKLSPMLDIKKALSTLGDTVEQVYVVSVDNECKEILIVMNKNVHSCEHLLTAVNLSSKGETSQLFSFHYEEEEKSCDYATTLQSYLYEPNASILKVGAFKSIASRFHLTKLHPNSHLYTSDTLHSDFPGRIFHIEDYSSFNKKELANLLQGINKGNLTVRNFPQDVATLRKKLKLNEGGDIYLFATTLNDGKKTLIKCRKVVVPPRIELGSKV